jgi:hypothetical protein
MRAGASGKPVTLCDRCPGSGMSARPHGRRPRCRTRGRYVLCSGLRAAGRLWRRQDAWLHWRASSPQGGRMGSRAPPLDRWLAGALCRPASARTAASRSTTSLIRPSPLDGAHMPGQGACRCACTPALDGRAIPIPPRNTAHRHTRARWNRNNEGGININLPTMDDKPGCLRQPVTAYLSPCCSPASPVPPKARGDRRPPLAPVPGSHHARVRQLLDRHGGEN